MGKRKRPAGGRGDSEDDDAGTGLFFLLSMLTCIIVPWSLAVIWSLLSPGRSEINKAFPTTTESGQRVRHCQTAAMASKRQVQVEYWKSRRRLFTRGFKVRLAILLLLWCWMIYIVVQIQTVMATSKLYQNFDPFDVLGIASGSTMDQIKKQFRTMSRKLHPDKNPSPNAAEQFMLVKKAYDCLTDPVAKRNFERFGNPDGPTKMELGVALPTFSGQNEGLVLLLFLFVFILGLPLLAVLLMNCGGESSKNERGVFLETEELVEKLMMKKEQKAIDESAARDIVAQSKETESCSKNDGTSQEELQAIGVLWKEFGKKNNGTADSSQLKGEMLLHAHLQRRFDLLTLPSLRTDLEELLPRWCLVTREIAERSRVADSLVAAVRMQRCLVQGLDVSKPAQDGSNLLLQAPHFSAERIKLWRKGPRKNANLLSLLELPADARKSSLKEVGFEDQELADVEDFVAVVPQLKITEAKVTVENEDRICQGDIAILKLKFDRQNLREDEAAGTIHSPLFPKSLQEAWWVLLTLDTKKNGKEQWRRKRIDDPSKTFEVAIRFPVERVGKSRCKVQVVSEVYDGVDFEHQVSFESQKPPEPPVDRSDDEDGEEDADEPFSGSE